MRRPVTWRILLLGFFFHPAFGLLGSPVIQTLEIRGTRRHLDMETRAGQTLDLASIERDVRHLWTTGWFDDIRAETSESAQGVRVIFTLAERPRLRLRRVKFEPAHARRHLGLEKGSPVGSVWAKRVAGDLRRQLVEEGYAEARVEAELSPVDDQKADLRLRVDQGRLYRVGEVRFSGSLGLKPKALRNALRSTRPLRLLPGLGRLWRGWRLLAPLSGDHFEADVERLRSLYLSRGYFDARVEIAGVDTTKGNATVTMAVSSGPRYRVRHLEVSGAEASREIPLRPHGEFPAQELCDCILKARRESEEKGQLSFSPRLEMAAAPLPAQPVLKTEARSAEPGDERALGGPWVDLRAQIENGPVYKVERIEFRGHRRLSDSTLRRALLLREGDLFDQGLLRRSLARLNRFPFLEPLTVREVRVEPSDETRLVKLTIPVKEKPRHRWSLSGPLGPGPAFGPLGYTIGSRLPSLGHGALELSTYYATFSLLAWPSPLAGLLSAPRIFWQPVFAVERPYLPGQDWKTGFILSPQLGWRGTLASYGLMQAGRYVHSSPGADSLLSPAIGVPAIWRAFPGDESANMAPAGILRCEKRKTPLARFRAAGAMIADIAVRWLVARPF